MTPTNDENYQVLSSPLSKIPLNYGGDGGGLRWPLAQRASGSERGGHSMFPLPLALSSPSQAPPRLPARREGLMPRREALPDRRPPGERG